MIGWTLTGIVFFIKPGYQGAFEQLSLKYYAITSPVNVNPQHQWQKIEVVRTILGEHLLVKSNQGITHLDPVDLNTRPVPSDSQIKALLSDAIANNKARYGDIVSVDGLSAKTSTGVNLTLNWNTLRLSQTGQDTQLINLLYKVHYLQWTPNKILNQVLGILGLVFLLSLTFLGIRIYLKQRR